MKMKNKLIVVLLVLATGGIQAKSHEKIQKGKFEASWESLQQYQTPEWYRNAKLGIWAHWGPQCEPENGDWYARQMYEDGNGNYKFHLKKYGHPSEFGFKDVIHEWKAEEWNPESLVKLYKKAGARYFFAMANHHDNLDLWNSKYQSWNSVKVGPHKNILEGWSRAARKEGLPFGVSVHAAHAWSWYETSQGSDKTGEKAGVSYDGNLTKKEGKGKWWNGLDPQDLYAQNHPLSDPSHKSWEQWEWGNGCSVPSEDYCNRFMDRTIDLINQFNPDLIYFDDTALPLWPVSDVGLKVAAHYYNHNMKTHHGELEGVIFGKILTEDQKKALVWDVERGAPDKMQDKPWQTCTCIGQWHYSRDVYHKNWYKSPKTVIQMLADIVSKNGNLLLNIPVRGNGTIDEKELAIVEEIGEWMKVFSDGIYDTRPWKIFGEGPTAENKNPMREQGFNEGKTQYSSKDIRFTQKNGNLYAIVMNTPEGNRIGIKSLSLGNSLFPDAITGVELLGQGKVEFDRTDEQLIIQLPDGFAPSMPFVLKIK